MLVYADNGSSQYRLQAMPLSAKRILIVEDNVHLSRTLSELLMNPQGEQYHIEMLITAEVALERIAKGNYDLLVSDYQLPGMSGLELLKRVHQANVNTGLLMMTSYGSPHLEAQIHEMGAAFFHKPLDYQEFITTVWRLLGDLPDSSNNADP